MKKLIFLLLFTLSLSADILDDKIKSLVDSNTFIKHQRLIDILFRERSEFFIGDNINYVKVVETLKENGLLAIFYPHPTDLTISFSTSISAVFFVKTITDILREMGYSYYMTTSFNKTSSYLDWSIEYKSDHVIDPVLLSQKLKRYNINIYELSCNKNIWKYDVGSSNLELADATNITKKDSDYSLLEPDGEYWLDLKTSANKLSVNNKTKNYWYPKVIFYDKNLNIIKIYKKNSVVLGFVLNIPPRTKFVKIGDTYSSDTLKRGVIIKTFN